MMLITLDQGKAHLNVVGDDSQDDEITAYIEAASDLVVGYLKSGADSFLDSNGETILDSNSHAVGIPFRVISATKLMLGYLYKDRDTNTANEWDMGYLPKPVMACLYQMRDPACS